MTGIAGLVHEGRVWLAGDSAGVADTWLKLETQPKVFARGEMVFGFTSSFWMGRILQHRFNIPDLPEDRSVASFDRWMCVDFANALRAEFKEAGYLKDREGRLEGGQFLVGVAGLLYFVDDDFHAGRHVHNFNAAGSGTSIILGSLYSTIGKNPEDRLLTALHAAEQFITTVRAPFHVISTPEPA